MRHVSSRLSVSSNYLSLIAKGERGQGEKRRGTKAIWRKRGRIIAEKAVRLPESESRILE